MCSRIKSAEGIADLIKMLEKEPSVVNYPDSEGNNILHYAVYNRNLPLVQALLNRFSSEGMFVQNKKLNNPMHLAVAAKHLSQLELPKMEELLV